VAPASCRSVGHFFRPGGKVYHRGALVDDEAAVAVVVELVDKRLDREGGDGSSLRDVEQSGPFQLCFRRLGAGLLAMTVLPVRRRPLRSITLPAGCERYRRRIPKQSRRGRALASSMALSSLLPVRTSTPGMWSKAIVQLRVRDREANGIDEKSMLRKRTFSAFQ
jgi:hypothetical protein